MRARCQLMCLCHELVDFRRGTPSVSDASQPTLGAHASLLKLEVVLDPHVEHLVVSVPGSKSVPPVRPPLVQRETRGG